MYAWVTDLRKQDEQWIVNGLDCKPMETGPKLVALFNSYLKPHGWNRSLDAGPVDANGGPLPWITYPAQTMLEQIVRDTFRVFEFGCGNSSLWWAARAKEVVSIDHSWPCALNPKFN